MYHLKLVLLLFAHLDLFKVINPYKMSILIILEMDEY